MFQSTHVNSLARTAHALVEGEGQGSTVYAQDALKRRYVVGGLTTRMFPVGEAVPTLRAAMHAMAGTQNGTIAETMGVWEDQGTVYVDLGTMFHSLDVALEQATHRGKLAVFDRETGERIRVEG